METRVAHNEQRSQLRSGSSADHLRTHIRSLSKTFKTSWIGLGQALCTVYQDKTFHAWGYDKFEHYVEQEVGLPKQLSLKLLKTYVFLEEEEPSYLTRDFHQNRESLQVPGYEAVNVLRLAKRNKDIPRNDFLRLKKDVFEKGKGASVVRQDLTSIIKERKQLDPIEEREKRSVLALRKCIAALESFRKDMEALKSVPNELIEQADQLKAKLEEHT